MRTEKAERAELLEQIAEVSQQEKPPEETVALGIIIAALAFAAEELDSTRWNPTGDLKEWRKTPEGQNAEAVATALKGVQSARALLERVARARVKDKLKRLAKRGGENLAPFDECSNCGSWRYTHEYSDLARGCPGFEKKEEKDDDA